MKNLFPTLISLLLLFGCQTMFESKEQTKFESKEQAKNEVDKNGYRIGRWVDYLNSYEQPTKDLDLSQYYVLSEYIDGNPIGEYKLFSLDNTIIKTATYVDNTKIYDVSNMPKSSDLGPTTYYEEGNIKRKDIPNEEGFLLKQILYSKNSTLNTIDSSYIEYERLPSQDIMKVTFKTDGDDEFYVDYFEEPWVGKKDTKKFYKFISSSDFLPEIKKDLEGKFSEDLIERFEYLMNPGVLLDRIHNFYCTDKGWVDIKATYNSFYAKPIIPKKNKPNTRKDITGKYKFELSTTKNYTIMIFTDGTVMGMTRLKRVELNDVGNNNNIDKGTWKQISESQFEIYWSDIPTWHCRVQKNNNGQVIGFIEDSGELIRKISSDPYGID